MIKITCIYIVRVRRVYQYYTSNVVLKPCITVLFPNFSIQHKNFYENILTNQIVFITLPP